jgi:predicted nucleic acid-binding protein
MAVYFVDSSALVKRYRFEAGSERVAKLLGVTDSLIVARLTQVEITSAIVRRGRANGLTDIHAGTAIATFERDLRVFFDIVELDAPVFALAIEMARKHGLRAADAIQLACAILARADAAGQDFNIVSSDLELNAAAEDEGMSVVDPMRH